MPMKQSFLIAFLSLLPGLGRLTVGGLNSMGRLASNSNGVFGLEGLSLNSAASNATQGSLIVSSTKNVHLASGTQLLIQTTERAQ